VRGEDLVDVADDITPPLGRGLLEAVCMVTGKRGQ
jgi:hypothetical protein